MPELYTVREVDNGFRVVKFDEMLNVKLPIYTVRGYIGSLLSCECWQQNKFQCRHRSMVLLFASLDRLSKGFFYDWDSQRWHLPVTEQYQELRKRKRKQESNYG